MSVNLLNMKILMVDDDLYNMRPTIDALEVRGAIVEIARTGTDALEILSKKIFDLVILDIMLTSGKGIETDDQGRSTGIIVYKRIRQGKLLKLPIVVSTVVSDPEYLLIFERDKKCKIINKPYTFKDILFAIDYVMNS